MNDCSEGLALLLFPCNQFGGQEPLSNDEMAEEYQRRFNLSEAVDLFCKVDVNGVDAHPVWWVVPVVCSFCVRLRSDKDAWRIAIPHRLLRVQQALPSDALESVEYGQRFHQVELYEVRLGCALVYGCCITASML